MVFHVHCHVRLFGVLGNAARDRGIGDAGGPLPRAFEQAVVERDTAWRGVQNDAFWLMRTVRICCG